MMTNLRMMIAGTALLALPTLASAQTAVRAEGSASLKVESMRGSDAPGGSAAGEAALRAALEAGLPGGPVRSVVARGEARGATEAQIERASLDTYARLRTSRDALRGEEDGREPSHAEIAAGAEALLSGASRTDLGVVRDAAPAERSLTASLTALAGMRARGIAGASAAAEVASRLAAGASDGAIAGLGAGVDAASHLGAAANGSSGVLDAAAGAGGSLDAVGGAITVGAGLLGSVRGGIR